VASKKKVKKKAKTFEEKLKKFRLHGRIVFNLRRLFMYSPHRKEALERAKVPTGDGLDRYLCAETGRHMAQSDVQVDHIVPVVDPAVGFPLTNVNEYNREGQIVSYAEVYDYTLYVNKLFDIDNLQVIGKDVHKQKTLKENKIRRARTAKRKKNKKA